MLVIGVVTRQRLGARQQRIGPGLHLHQDTVEHLSQNRRVDALYREPDIVFDNMALRWGRHQLRFLHNAGKTMGHVVEAVQQVNGLIGEITGASQEQSMGLSQINQAVVQLDNVTQQNSAMVEELAAAASSLQTQAQVMNEAVRIFRLERRSAIPA